MLCCVHKSSKHCDHDKYDVALKITSKIGKWYSRSRGPSCWGPCRSWWAGRALSRTRRAGWGMGSCVGLLSGLGLGGLDQVQPVASCRAWVWLRSLKRELIACCTYPAPHEPWQSITKVFTLIFNMNMAGAASVYFRNLYDIIQVWTLFTLKRTLFKELLHFLIMPLLFFCLFWALIRTT